VTALDQSVGSLAELDRKLASQPELRRRVTTCHRQIEHYRSRERHDLILCVFTVVNHLLDEASIEAFAQMAFQRLRAGGYLVLGMVTKPVTQNTTVNLPGLRRQVDLEAQGEDKYRGTELCEGTFQKTRFKYRETFELCMWGPGEIQDVLHRAGFWQETDPDLGDLARWDAECFLFRKPDLRRRRHKDPDEDPWDTWKDVVQLGEAPSALPPGHEDGDKILALPAIHLDELIDLMRMVGFWLNPKLPPSVPEWEGNLTKLLPHLARCRLLVQCNQDRTQDQVHHGMATLARGSQCGSARIDSVTYIPIINAENLFQQPKVRARDRSWEHLRQLVRDTVEMKPEQCWIGFYRVALSFDAQHERLLRIVHLACHPLAAFTFFLAPNGLVPEKIVKL